MNCHRSLPHVDDFLRDELSKDTGWELLKPNFSEEFLQTITDLIAKELNHEMNDKLLPKLQIGQREHLIEWYISIWHQRR